MNRDRMSKQPVGVSLTFSDYIGMVFEEPLILHSTAHRLRFKHWAEHIYSFLDIYRMNHHYIVVKKDLIYLLLKLAED